MSANVFELEPNVAPLVVLMNRLGATPAQNPKIEWNEDESMPRITTLSASATSNATAFGPTNDIFRVNDVVRVTNASWSFLVTATAAGAVTGTVLASAAHAQASAASGSELYIVSNANQEGATLREIKYPQLVTASNYCEIVRTPFGLTETEKATTHYGGDEEDRLSSKFGREHARSIEQVAFFGVRDIQSTNQRFCGGLKEFIATNVTNAGGALTESSWQSFLKTGFRYGSERKVAFCSPTVVGALEGYARSNIKTSGSEDHATNYGITMKTYVSGQGTVDIVLHRDWNDSATYGGYCFLVDMDAVKYRPLRDTKLRQNVQAPDYDGRKSEYITEASVQVIHERRHALLTGVTG